MANVIVAILIIIASIVSIRSIIKSKKNGQSCSCCPNASTCNKKNCK